MDLLTALQERVRAARASDPDPDGPLTIGDVYQRLIPYRSIREELGVLEFSAYEHALLRLFSGEGNHLVLPDERAREEIQRELSSVNPILGIYRDYADTAIVLVNGGTPTPPAPPPPAPIEAIWRDPAEDLPNSSPSAAQCRYCAASLPDIQDLQFCPFCGETQGARPCIECGTPVEPEWSFCVRCGVRQTGDPSA